MRDKRQKKKTWRNRNGVLTLFLVLALVLTAIPLQQAMVVRAEEVNPDLVIRWDSTQEELVNATISDDGVVYFSELTVEEGHFIIIEGANVRVTTLNLKEGARVEVLNDNGRNPDTTHTGTFSWDTINASDGSRILLQSKGNIPENMAIYRWKSPEETGEGPFTLLSDDNGLAQIDWTEVEFTVLDGETSGRWVWHSYDYDSFLPSGDTIVVELLVKNYPTEITEQNFPLILPENISDDNQIFGGDRIKIRVPATTNSINIGWDEANKPRTIGVANANPDSEDGWLITNDPEGTSYELKLNLNEVGDSLRDFYCVEFNYRNDPNSGNDPGNGNEPSNGEDPNNGGGIDGLFERLNKEQGAALHAYGNQVLSGETVSDNNEDTSVEDLRLGWAKYLAGDFAVGEGRYQGIGEYIRLEPNPNKSSEIENRNVEKVKNLITCTRQATTNDITASNYAGESETLEAYTLTFSVLKQSQAESQQESQQQSFQVTTTAYMIQKEDVSSGFTYAQVVIKIGNEFYIRNAGDIRNEETGEVTSEFVSLGANDNKDNTRALNIVTNAYTTGDEVILFGNNASLTQEELSDDSAKAYFVNNFWMNENGQEMGGKIAIYRPDFTGVFLKPDTESTQEALAWEINTSYDIKESGVDVETDFYFGYSKAILSAITGDKLTDLEVQKLSNVEVLGDIPDNAVKVNNNNDGTFMVEFLSDYYDEVEIGLTYLLEDGTQKQNTLTINRVGIVVQYGRTPGDDKTRVQIHHGHDSGEFITYNGEAFGGVIYATYYHPQGTGNIGASDTSLYVTLHYKDGTTEQKIIKADFFKGEANGKTAMSDYVLAIAPNGTNIEDTLPVKVEAIAVENADANGRFNGAKLGAGKGVQCAVNFED